MPFGRLLDAFWTPFGCLLDAFWIPGRLSNFNQFQDPKTPRTTFLGAPFGHNFGPFASMEAVSSFVVFLGASFSHILQF